MKEMVNSPKHYNQGKIECIDAMVSAFGANQVRTFCKINAFKYLWRLGCKDAEEQEIGKIKWYLDKYLALQDQAIPDAISRLSRSNDSLKDLLNEINHED